MMISPSSTSAGAFLRTRAGFLAAVHGAEQEVGASRIRCYLSVVANVCVRSWLLSPSRP